MKESIIAIVQYTKDAPPHSALSTVHMLANDALDAMLAYEIEFEEAMLNGANDALAKGQAAANDGNEVSGQNESATTLCSGGQL